MALKPKGKDVANSAAIHSSEDTLSASTSPGRSNGNSKVIPGPRLGVYRPCARCRLKKTKCDRLRPSCSSCAKGGSDALCVYDNDEPGDGSDYESITSTPIAAPSSINSKKDSDQQNRRRPVGSGYENGQESRSSNSNGNGNGNLSNYDSSTDSRMDTTSTQLSTTAIERAPHAEPPQKKLKTGAGTSEAITPSPLRSSITTNREPVPRETESALDENVDIESIDAVDDQDISGLSIADATLERANSEINQDDIPDTMEVGRNPVSTGAAKSKKQTKGLSTSTSGVGTGAHTKIMVELPTVRPSPMFVINKSQRARKWGRSSAIVQTLGGEISIPLWISDQDMLLNEPRPYFMQRVYPMSTLPSPFGPSSTSATATNLARLAVLNQMDNNGYDTPERGTTPESGEGSPAPPSSQLMKMKKKKRIPKQGVPVNSHNNEDDDVDSATTTTSITGAKRKRGPLSTAPGSSTITGVGDDDAGDSSARSTPAPTSKPRPIPTRPRMYPCSFDGCGKSFMDKFHLKRHETRHVTQVIVCGIDGCTKAYDSISTMRRHQSMIHKERKEEIAAAAAAAAVAAAASASASASVTRSGTVEVEEGEEDGESEISGSSPSPSSVTYTAMSSPARD
ncbi:hypothetical protein BGZ99_001475 [Dissophora globulifera]|uniref:Uncharacterized protein n=1 Tax=Dissophora globulifera TaxID=979702 RepID=A0A9P6RPM4_9FUNG|nr:hypothetical protein BGZ99_001475 [Dissophora globulifera]